MKQQPPPPPPAGGSSVPAASARLGPAPQQQVGLAPPPPPPPSAAILQAAAAAANQVEPPPVASLSPVNAVLTPQSASSISPPALQQPSSAGAVQPTRKGSLPPPIPANLQKQYAASYAAANIDAPAPTLASAPGVISPPPVNVVRPAPPPRPSVMGSPLGGSALQQQFGAVLATVPASSSLGSAPARSGPPPPPPGQPSQPSPSLGSSQPPPPPPHLRTDSATLSGPPGPPLPPSSTSSNASANGGGGGNGYSPSVSQSQLNQNQLFSPFSALSPSPEPPRSGTTPAAAAAGASLVSPAGSQASMSKQEWKAEGDTFIASFAKQLPHRFDTVVDQSNAGMRLLKRVRAFMQRFSALQERYAVELQKITSVERNKLIAMPKADGMSSCYVAWLGLFEKMDELSQANLSFAQDVKETTAEPLEKWYLLGNKMITEQKSEQERVAAAQLKAAVSLAKERDMANQALQKLASKRLTVDEGGAGGGPGASPSCSSGTPGSTTGASGGPAGVAGDKQKKSSVMGSLFKSSDPVKSFEKSKDAAIKACESYSAQLTAANTSSKRYNEVDLPAMLTQMQSLEEMRLHSLNSAMKDFSRIQAEFTSRLQDISGVIGNLSRKMDATSDMANFVTKVVTEHGPALPAQPHTWDLPLSLGELKALQFDEPPSSLFYSTVDGVMKHQLVMQQTLGTTASTVAASGTSSADTARHASLELPLIVPTLLRSIHELGGCQTEGIFRISVGSEDLAQVRRDLERGDLSLSGISSPHVPACALKSWFRDLLVPVFPFEMYSRVIAAGQVEPWSSRDPSSTMIVKAVLQDLPLLNAKILCTLFGFLKRLGIEPIFVAKTRMNLANLSMVFSPGLVRSEKNDPLQMLQDTKYASSFVSRAIECTPAAFSAEAQRCAAQLLDEIFSSNVFLH